MSDSVDYETCACKRRLLREGHLICSLCAKEAEIKLAQYQSMLDDRKRDEVTSETIERWSKFIESKDLLSEYLDFDQAKIKHNRQYAKLDDFIDNFDVPTSNKGRGFMFIGDYSTEARFYAMYTLRRLVMKHIEKKEGFVSFDYVNWNECVESVYAPPSDSFYASSQLLLLDSVDLEMLLEDKLKVKSFYLFVRYRLDNHRPTLLVINNAMSKTVKALDTYFELAYGENRIHLAN